MVKLTFNKEHNVLVIKVSGAVSSSDVIECWEAIEKDTKLPRNLKILQDSTESIVNFPMDELKKIEEKTAQVCEKFSSVRHALINNRPINTAMAILLDDHIKSNKYRLKVFNTYESATEWLHI